MTLRHDATTTDAELIRRVLDGDEPEFRELYRRHTPRLRGVVLRLLAGNSSDADDATQEAWVRAVARLADFRGDSEFSTWLAGFGIRVSWEMQRRRRPGALLDDDAPGIDPPDTGAQLDLADALARLSVDQRTVVALHDVEGFSHDEIGALLDIAPSTSRSHLFRARRSLRTLLGAYQGLTHE